MTRVVLSTLVLNTLLLVTVLGQYQSIDGSGNHPIVTSRGQAGTQFKRYNPTNAYVDNVAAPPRFDIPISNPRDISNLLSDKIGPRGGRDVTDFVVWWGQFFDHDITLTKQEGGSGTNGQITWDITDDPVWDPEGLLGTRSSTLTRNDFISGTGGIRQQINYVTHWLDGSQVYGSDATIAAALRTGSGGRMVTRDTEAGEMLPYAVDLGIEDEYDNPVQGNTSLLLACGDIRCNEQPMLASLHTLFVREHNRRAAIYEAANPGWTDEEIYQEARKMVRSILQKITFEEYAVKNFNLPNDYVNFAPPVDASIDNGFSAAAFRYGHSEVNSVMPRVDANFQESEAGHMLLRNVFFQPHVLDEDGIDTILRGALVLRPKTVDIKVEDDLRSFLFPLKDAATVTSNRGAHGMDLFAINNVRGREHGIPDYNNNRDRYMLDEVTSYAEISSDPEVQAVLEQIYGPAPGGLDNIDPYIGGLAEDPIDGLAVGEYFRAVINIQLKDLRDGDPYFFRANGVLTSDELAEIEATTLGQVIRDNTDCGTEVPLDVFSYRTADCQGVLGGPAVVDGCGDCTLPGSSSFNLGCADCAGTPYGTFEYDTCGNCLDPEDSEFDACVCAANVASSAAIGGGALLAGGIAGFFVSGMMASGKAASAGTSTKA